MCATFTITCPGVWLCMDSGYIEATIKTLGYFFRTTSMEPPRFPFLCHDRFTMEGYFSSVSSMAELERVLAAEQVEITMWQSGRRLAHFVGKLSDVMQNCHQPKLTCEHHVNVQLLMKPSPAFPGIIAPKVELSAQVDVLDRLLASHSVESSKFCKSFKSNKLLTPNFDCVSPTQRYHSDCQQSEACCMSYSDMKRRQQPVCHVQDARTDHHVVESPPDFNKKFQERCTSETSHEHRRFSNFSSLLSNISYPSTQVTSTASSGNNSSKCCDSRNSHKGLGPVEDHQQRCEICQTYQKVFRLPKTVVMP